VGQVEADHGKAAKAEFPPLERYQRGANPIPLAHPLAASWHVDSFLRRGSADEVIRAATATEVPGDQMGERLTVSLLVSAQGQMQQDRRRLWTVKWWRQQRCFDGAPGVRPAAVGAPSSPARASTLRRSGIPSVSSAGLRQANARVVHSRRI
jgi:hypothetical protein